MANGKANTFWGLGTNQYGNPTPLTQGLMQVGQGLLAASSAPPAQRGAIYAQALDPTRMMQLRQQEEQQRAWEQIVKNATLPSGTETPQPQPMLGGYPTDVPGGPPGASQVAMVPGAPAESLAAPTPIKPRSGSLLDDNQRSLLMALGPNHPMSQAILMQAMTPKERKIVKGADGRNYYVDTGEPVLPGVTAPAPKPYSTIGQLIADRDAGRISQEDFDREMAIRAKPQTEINLPKEVTEVEGTLNAIEENRRKFEETGEARYKRMADSLEMKLAFGGKPPEAYVKARNSIQSAREGIGETYELIAKGQADPLDFKDRAKVAQAMNKARLAYADMLNRGANFTESEQAMIDAMLGGDPNNMIDRTLRGDQSYLNRLRAAGEALERRGAGLLQSFTTPGIGEYSYPWQRGEAQLPEGVSEEDIEFTMKKHGLTRAEVLQRLQ